MYSRAVTSELARFESKMAKTGQMKTAKTAEASKILMILASVALVIAGAKASADFIVPVLLAFFIATVSFPLPIGCVSTEYLERSLFLSQC